MHLYERLAAEIASQIRCGAYEPGARLPSVRELSRSRGVSPATGLRTYRELERRGQIVAVAKSGFFVSVRRRSALSRARPPTQLPTVVTNGQRVLRLLSAANEPAIVNFGAATPALDLMPSAAIATASRSVWRSARRRCMGQAFPPGTVELRTAIARRLALRGCAQAPDDLLITNGCQEALSIALGVICRRGDIVAVEAPTYYGVLDVLEQLGLRALSIPCDPVGGLSLADLERSVCEQPVAACVVTPVASNPLGVTLSDERKRELMALSARYKLPLVEYDTYGDLIEGGRRHVPLKAWDEADLVHYCGSATKTFCAGMRLGWLAAPARYRQAIAFQQVMRSVSVNTRAQLTLADYLTTGDPDRAMRRAAHVYHQSVARLSESITEAFPEGTLISAPQGGYLVWVELPRDVDTIAIHDQALARGISFAPGALFSVDGRSFGHCLRLNAAVGRDARAAPALVALGRLLARHK